MDQQISAGCTIQSPGSITIQEMGDTIFTDFKPWVSFTILDMNVQVGLFCQNRPSSLRLKNSSLFIFLKNADSPVFFTLH